MAKKLVNTKKITNDQWLALRRQSLGGSDAGTCVGMNQYSSLITLYSRKKGLVKDVEDNEAMRLGRDLEQYVADRFTEATGKKVINDTFMYMDDEYDFITANVDRKVVGEKAGLECKTMGSFNGYNIESGEIPAHYFCQIQHYCMVMNWECMYIGILVLQRGFYWHKIERDDEFIKQLREAEIEFWTQYVVPGRIPAPDGSEASMETLKELYPDGKDENEISIFGLDEMIRDYKAFSALKKEYEEKAEAVKASICAKLGDHVYGKGIEYGCSWKPQSRASVDAKKLKAKFPDVYKEVVKVSNFRKLYTRQLKKKEK